MTRSMLTGIGAAALVAAVTLTAPSAWAFSTENLNTSQNGDSRFADPDDQVKNFGHGSQPFGPSGPTLQFGGGSAYGGSAYGRPAFAPTPTPPQPYARPLGNGD
jgi:hypothetical protein